MNIRRSTNLPNSFLASGEKRGGRGVVHWVNREVVMCYGLWKFFIKIEKFNPPLSRTTYTPSTVALTLIGRQQSSQSETRSIS